IEALFPQQTPDFAEKEARAHHDTTFLRTRCWIVAALRCLSGRSDPDRPCPARRFRKKLTEKLLSSFKKFEPGTSDLKRLAPLFDGGDFNLLFKFHKTVIPVDGAPDLKIAEGAGLCAGLKADKGKLSTSRPIYIGGVTALGGILDFCQIDVST